MTTEVCRVHILWIFRITTITPAKSPIQNCLRGGFRERVGMRTAERFSGRNAVGAMALPAAQRQRTSFGLCANYGTSLPQRLRILFEIRKGIPDCSQSGMPFAFIC